LRSLGPLYQLESMWIGAWWAILVARATSACVPRPKSRRGVGAGLGVGLGVDLG